MLNTILSRRSIRKYTAQPVPVEMIEQILRAGMAAPSARNEQPWHFVVVTERDRLANVAAVHPYAQMLREASFAVVVCGDTSRETVKEYWVQDCSAATQNMLLAAHALGLGGVWLGVYPRPERIEPIKTLFGLPERVMPLCVLSFGYPDEKKPPADRYDSGRVHNNHWDT